MSTQMQAADRSQVLRAITTVIGEILDGAAGDAGWLLNPTDPGLLRSLDNLTAARASAPAPQGGASIAAHAEHLRYGLELLNRWSRGESPFGDADWAAAWRRPTVTEEEWEVLRTRLREEARRWQEGLGALVGAGPEEITGVIASAAHLAYHLGAIRQIDRATHGPYAERR
jgi:hypothetical protein